MLAELAQYKVYQITTPTSRPTNTSACLSTQERKQETLVVMFQDSTNLKSFNTEKGCKTAWQREGLGLRRHVGKEKENRVKKRKSVAELFHQTNLSDYDDANCH